MKKILFIGVLAALAGCVTSGVKLQGPIEKVGVIVNQGNNALCHEYIGLTVFSNFVKSYALPFEYSAIVEESISEFYRSKGVDVQYIEEDRISGGQGNFMVRSSWDNSGSLLPEFRSKFLEVASNNNLDAVYVVTGDPITGQIGGCVGVINYRSGKNGTVVYPPLIHVYSSEGVFAGLISAHGVEDIIEPDSDKTLSDEFLKDLGSQISEIIKRSLEAY